MLESSCDRRAGFSSNTVQEQMKVQSAAGFNVVAVWRVYGNNVHWFRSGQFVGIMRHNCGTSHLEKQVLSSRSYTISSEDTLSSQLIWKLNLKNAV